MPLGFAQRGGQDYECHEDSWDRADGLPRRYAGSALMFRMFSRLFKTQDPSTTLRTLPPTSKAPVARPLSRADLFFLSIFDQPKDPAEASNYLKAILQKDTITTAKGFLRAGLIEGASELGCLLASTKLPDLKQALKTAGMKVSGKKEELASRLLENKPDIGRQMITGKYYILTSEGHSQVKVFQDEEDEADERLTNEWLRCFEQRSLSGLLATYRAYSKWLIQPPESSNTMTITLPDDRILEMYQAILEARPAILGKVSEAHLSYLRRCTAWNFAGGGRGGSNRFPPPLDFSCTLEATVAIRMVSFAAKHNITMASYKHLGIKKVKISACGAASCNHCMKFDGKTFSLGKAPELPHPKCTHEMGCRCFAIADFEGLL